MEKAGSARPLVNTISAIFLNVVSPAFVVRSINPRITKYLDVINKKHTNNLPTFS